MTVHVHRELAERGSFSHLKLGRSSPSSDSRTLRLAKYLDASVVLPAVPDVFDVTPPVASWPMYGNDRLGDCTCAAVGHMIQAWTAAQHAEAVVGDDVIEQLYIPDTGSSDTGRVETDVLNYWRKNGVGGHQLGAYASVEASNDKLVRAAAYLFGGLYIGVALPATAQRQPVWDVDASAPAADREPGSWGGHAVDVVAYTPDAITVVTWGGLLRMTWPFWHMYVDEAYALMSADWLGAGVTPDGLNAAELAADLQAVSR